MYTIHHSTMTVAIIRETINKACAISVTGNAKSLLMPCHAYRIKHRYPDDDMQCDAQNKVCRALIQHMIHTAACSAGEASVSVSTGGRE